MQPTTLAQWRDAGQRFRFGDHSIFFRAHGGGETALLLIHGFPTASWDWAPLWSELTRHFAHVIALDMLGFGFSDKPRRHRYSLFEQTDMQEALLRERGVRRVHLLAHDYGVSVAQEMLARQLARHDDDVDVRSLVLLNGGLFPEMHRATTVQKLLNSPVGALVARAVSEKRFAKTFSGLFGPGTRPSANELHDFWTLVAANGGQRIAHRLIKYIGERRKHRERWVGALQNTRVPIRLINGPEDPVSGAHMVVRYRELMPNPDVISLPGIGHYPQVEAPDRVLQEFLAFHERLAQARTGISGGGDQLA